VTFKKNLVSDSGKISTGFCLPSYAPAIMSKFECSVLLVALSFAAAAFAQAPGPSPVEAAMVKAVDAETPAAVALLEKIVNMNSGTMNLAGVVAVKEVIEPEIAELGFKTRWEPMNSIGRAGDLVAVHPCPAGAGKCGERILLIGHMDTVFEPSSSFQKYSIVPGTDGKVATGPGVNDMKGGLVVMLTALEAMKAAGALDHAEIRIVLSGDEERHGSPISISRKDMIDAAKQSDVALEFESGGNIDGKDVQSISRRSAGTWKLETSGRSGHSSQIFGEKMGDGAVYEMARILDAFRKELREQGLTYNVGLVLGGSTAKVNESGTGGDAAGKNNVVPPVAIAIGDFRTLDNDQTARVEAKMQKIVADHLPRTGAVITFDEGYPAMAPTEAGHALVKKLNEVNATLGLPAEAEMDPMLRGAGDIAFVAPYIPGLVGTGVMGEGAHAEGETIYLDSIPRQAKRMALLMYRLSKS
jgi:glutamate carboxypeptidase